MRAIIGKLKVISIVLTISELGQVAWIFYGLKVFYS